MRDRLSLAGFRMSDEPDSADVLVINSCSFLEAATEESLDVILEAVSEWKPAKPDRRVVVAGCLPSRYGQDLTVELPEVDAFVPVADEEAVVEVIVGLIGSANGAPGQPSASGSFEYMTVCDGCDRSCTFCTIPAIRGSFSSRPAEEIQREAVRLVAQGAQELVLVGQDISSYADAGSGLPELVTRLASLEGLGWLRLMYVQPDGVTDELLEAIAANEVVCHYLDVPLQHVARDVLRSMGRRGGPQEHLDLVTRIRSVLPDVVLRTTLISGFPGETEDDAELLEEFIRDAAIDHVGVFPYSPEEGTAAAALPDRVPAELALERARGLREIADEVALVRFRSLAGSTLDVLVDGVEDDLPAGRWYGQAPEVDGIVRLDRPVEPGRFVRARVEDAVGHDLIAVVEP
jgi:ribosomal protein S12 methylthiotransferase